MPNRLGYFVKTRPDEEWGFMGWETDIEVLRARFDLLKNTYPEAAGLFFDPEGVFQTLGNEK